MNAATIIIMDNNMGTYINKCYKEPSSHSRLYNNPKMPYIRTLVIRYNNKGYWTESIESFNNNLR